MLQREERRKSFRPLEFSQVATVYWMAKIAKLKRCGNWLWNWSSGYHRRNNADLEPSANYVRTVSIFSESKRPRARISLL